jgi:hypothetical protein
LQVGVVFWGRISVTVPEISIRQVFPKGFIAMKKWIALVSALAILAIFGVSASHAAGWGQGTTYGSGPYRPFGCGAGIYSAPWYLFYPYDNYFNMPAPPAYPYWPQQNFNGAATGGTTVPGAYFPNPGSVPNYWLGR